MKLPFSAVLNPIIRPYFTETRQFCQHPTFAISIFYTYFYGITGFLINLSHIYKHLGEVPQNCATTEANSSKVQKDFMVIHDLKIIATSMAIIQYACLLVGCFTENPALFLPHLAGQIIVGMVKFVNMTLLLGQFNMKNSFKLANKLAAIVIMVFNWLQEFCVFRQLLCICDL